MKKSAAVVLDSVVPVPDRHMKDASQCCGGPGCLGYRELSE